MTSEDDMDVIKRYQAVAEDFPSPLLDRAVGEAIYRQAALNRRLRRLKEVSALAALTGIACGVIGHIDTVRDSRNEALAAEFGKTEGLARYYLLQTGSSLDPVPGATEGAP